MGQTIGTSSHYKQFKCVFTSLTCFYSKSSAVIPICIVVAHTAKCALRTKRKKSGKSTCKKIKCLFFALTFPNHFINVTDLDEDFIETVLTVDSTRSNLT